MFPSDYENRLEKENNERKGRTAYETKGSSERFQFETTGLFWKILKI